MKQSIAFQKGLFILFFSVSIHFVQAQQYGVGIAATFINQLNPYFQGWDTTGISNGSTPRRINSPSYLLPTFRPSLVKRYKNGTRMKEWSVGVDYRNYKIVDDGYFADQKFYYGAKNIRFSTTFNSTKYFRLLSTKNEKLRLWLGVQRIFYTYYNQNIPLSSASIPSSRLGIGVDFKVTPQLEYQHNKNLYFYLSYRNPSIARFGVRYLQTKNPALPIKYQRSLDFENQLGIYLYDTRWRNNFQLGVRYCFGEYKAENLIKKPAKEYWGIGMAMNIYRYKTWEYSTYSDLYAIDKWNIKPHLSVYHIANNLKNYQEYYLDDLSFSKKKEYIGYTANTNNGEVLQYSIGTTSRSRFKIGFVNYKRINKLSKGVVNFYYGFNWEYLHSSYSGSLSEGYSESYKLNGIRVSITPTILWRINDNTLLETKWIPQSFAELSLETVSTQNPLLPKYNKTKKNWMDYSQLDLEPNFQIGLKYAFKVIKPKKVKKKKN